MGHFENSFFKPFGLDQPGAFLLPSSELNGHPRQFSVACFSGLYFSQAFKFSELKLQVSVRRITALSCSTYNHILNLRHARIDFLWLKLGVISIAKTAHDQGASNESPKLYYKSYFARHFYVRINAVLKLWVTGKCMCNIKLIGAFARLFCFLENC